MIFTDFLLHVRFLAAVGIFSRSIIFEHKGKQGVGSFTYMAFMLKDFIKVCRLIALDKLFKTPLCFG